MEKITLESGSKEKYDFHTVDGLYGSAVSYSIIDSDGKMWIGNGEYESQVNYCPMTGKSAPTQLKVVKEFNIYNRIVEVYE